jgi:LysM repeat protein
MADVRAAATSNADILWNTVVYPRLGDDYAWGGSFSGSDPGQGTDCSGAVSTELSALKRGADLIWERQFWTGTFADIEPGAVGPFNNIDDTAGLVCIADPSDAPADAAMVIAIIQDPNPEDAHMICRVGGVDIEMGGQSNNYHTSVSDPTCASVTDTDEFNQWFYLPGGSAPPPPPPAPAPPPGPGTTYTIQSGDTLSSIALNFGVPLTALEAANPQITDYSLIYAGQVITIPAQ